MLNTTEDIEFSLIRRFTTNKRDATYYNIIQCTLAQVVDKIRNAT